MWWNIINLVWITCLFLTSHWLLVRPSHHSIPWVLGTESGYYKNMLSMIPHVRIWFMNIQIVLFPLSPLVMKVNLTHSFLLCLVFWNRVSLCSPDWPLTQRALLASASQILGLKMCVQPWLSVSFFKIETACLCTDSRGINVFISGTADWA